MLIKDYSLLPDYMDLGDISDKIEEILVFSSHNKTSTVDVAQALLEMIHRQGENYSERFSDDVVLKIKKWIIDFWDFSSWDLFKITSAIIVNLDFYYFPEGFKLLESALDNPDVRIAQRAKESLNEMTDTFQRQESLKF